eukprot:2682254-Rhodomonas_salina.1
MSLQDPSCILRARGQPSRSSQEDVQRKTRAAARSLLLAAARGVRGTAEEAAGAARRAARGARMIEEEAGGAVRGAESRQACNCMNSLSRRSSTISCTSRKEGWAAGAKMVWQLQRQQCRRLVSVLQATKKPGGKAWGRRKLRVWPPRAFVGCFGLV